MAQHTCDGNRLILLMFGNDRFLMDFTKSSMHREQLRKIDCQFNARENSRPSQNLVRRLALPLPCQTAEMMLIDKNFFFPFALPRDSSKSNYMQP